MIGHYPHRQMDGSLNDWWKRGCSQGDIRNRDRGLGYADKVDFGILTSTCTPRKLVEGSQGEIHVTHPLQERRGLTTGKVHPNIFHDITQVL
jgi:hypothetical protein